MTVVYNYLLLYYLLCICSYSCQAFLKKPSKQLVITNSKIYSPIHFKLKNRLFMIREESEHQEIRTQSVVFTALAALAVAISYADRSNISTAIIPMASQFQWDSFYSGIVLSSFWLGYACTQIVGGTLADRYGGEALLVFAMLTWSLCTGTLVLTHQFLRYHLKRATNTHT